MTLSALSKLGELIDSREVQQLKAKAEETRDNWGFHIGRFAQGAGEKFKNLIDASRDNLEEQGHSLKTRADDLTQNLLRGGQQPRSGGGGSVRPHISGDMSGAFAAESLARAERAAEAARAAAHDANANAAQWEGGFGGQSVAFAPSPLLEQFGAVPGAGGARPVVPPPLFAPERAATGGDAISSAAMSRLGAGLEHMDEETQLALALSLSEQEANTSRPMPAELDIFNLPTLVGACPPADPPPDMPPPDMPPPDMPPPDMPPPDMPPPPLDGMPAASPAIPSSAWPPQFPSSQPSVAAPPSAPNGGVVIDSRMNEEAQLALALRLSLEDAKQQAAAEQAELASLLQTAEQVQLVTVPQEASPPPADAGAEQVQLVTVPQEASPPPAGAEQVQLVTVPQEASPSPADADCGAATLTPLAEVLPAAAGAPAASEAATSVLPADAVAIDTPKPMSASTTME